MYFSRWAYRSASLRKQIASLTTFLGRLLCSLEYMAMEGPYLAVIRILRGTVSSLTAINHHRSHDHQRSYYYRIITILNHHMFCSIFIFATVNHCQLSMLEIIVGFSLPSSAKDFSQQCKSECSVLLGPTLRGPPYKEWHDTMFGVTWGVPKIRTPKSPVEPHGLPMHPRNTFDLWGLGPCSMSGNQNCELH